MKRLLAVILLLALVANSYSATGKESISEPSSDVAGGVVPLCDNPMWRAPQARGWLAPAIRSAELLANAPLAPWDEGTYKEYSQTGRRESGERMLRQRIDPLRPLVLAECAERKGRFLPALERTLDALSRQPSWTLPAVDPKLVTLRGEYIVDLNACETAHDAAWALRLIGPYIRQDIRDRLVSELEKRIFTPLQRIIELRKRNGAALGSYWWIEGRSNWNAVCVSSVVGAAYAMNRDDLDYWLSFGRESIRYYLESLRDDGYADEGPAYWNYGFGAFLRFRETLLWAAPNGPDLMQDAKARAMAAYPRRVLMPGSVVAPFGDAPAQTHIDPVRQAHAEVAIGWTTTDAWAKLARPTSSGGRLNEAVWRLWGWPSKAAGETMAIDNSNCSLFPESGVAVLRPLVEPADLKRLSVTIRTGGSRSHAHDDAGSYAISLGGAMISGDPGAPIYTRDTFGPNRRQNPFVNSYGHPVPKVDGHLQRDSNLFQAKWALTPCAHVSNTTNDAVIDLASVYDVPNLKKIIRELDYDDHDGRYIAFVDRFTGDRALAFETAILIRGSVSLVGKTLEFKENGAHLAIDVAASGDWEALIDTVEDQPSNSVTRIGLRLLKPTTNGCIKYRFRLFDDATQNGLRSC
jgi:hypothetical protein